MIQKCEKRRDGKGREREATQGEKGTHGYTHGELEQVAREAQLSSAQQHFPPSLTPNTSFTFTSPPLELPCRVLLLPDWITSAKENLERPPASDAEREWLRSRSP